MELTPCTIIGKTIRLEPLTLDHYEACCEAGLFEGLFRWYPEPVHSREDMYRFIEKALLHQTQNTALPFATIKLDSGKLIGSTRFGSISHRDRRAEIGWTWITPSEQRTPANTEAKYMMLQHAFETLDCERVELKTHALNLKSRAAILRIGAVQEGILRHHMLTDDGGFRDTVYFSVLKEEWPGVKARLSGMLNRSPKALL